MFTITISFSAEIVTKSQRYGRSTHQILGKKSQKRSKCEHFFAFMKELLDNNHAKVAPPLAQDKECWYLPVFGIYHPKKPGRIGCVFDLSATYEIMSLNSELLSGLNSQTAYWESLYDLGKKGQELWKTYRNCYIYTPSERTIGTICDSFGTEITILTRTLSNTVCMFMCLGTNHHHPLQTMHYRKLLK